MNLFILESMVRSGRSCRAGQGTRRGQALLAYPWRA